MIKEKLKIILTNPYIAYAIFFIPAVIALFFAFYAKGVSPIRYSDGLNQYFYCLCYQGQWLRTVFHNIFVEHSFFIPTYDLSIGYGSSIVASMHYYGFGDPINLLSVFFSYENMESFYVFGLILRLFLAGFCIIAFFKVHFGSLKTEFFFGALIYVFCGFTIFSGIRWISFLNPLITFPILLAGISKVIRSTVYADNARHFDVLFLLLGVVYASVSGIYFFYMQCILLIPFSIYLYFHIIGRGEGRGISSLIACASKVFIIFILGLVCSLPILLPVIETLLTSSRVGGGSFPVFYGGEYYKKLWEYTAIADSLAFDPMVSGEGFGFFPVIIPVFIIALFHIKKLAKELALLSFLLIVLCLPWFTHVLNGFGYLIHRWLWVFGVAVGLLTVSVISDDEYAGKICHILGLAVSLLVSFRLYKTYSLSKYLCVSIVLLILGNAIFISKKYRNISCYFAAFLLVIWTFIGSWHTYSVPEGRLSYLNYVKSGKAYDQILSSDAEVIREISSKVPDIKALGVFRYGSYGIKKHSDLNTAALAGVYGSQFYYSVTDDNVYDHYTDLYMPAEKVFRYEDLDSRFIPETLAGERYFIVKKGDEKCLPAGHYKEPVYRDDNYSVYENEYRLPLAYVFHDYIDRDDWLELNAAERQLCLTKAAVVDVDEGFLSELSFISDIGSDVDREYEGADEYTDSDKGEIYDVESLAVEAYKHNASYRPCHSEVKEWKEGEVYSCSENEEIYLLMDDVDYAGELEDAGINVTFNGRKKHFSFNGPKNGAYIGRRKLGFMFRGEPGGTESVIDILMDPDLLYDGIYVVKLDLSEAFESIKTLREESMELYKENSNTYYGSITLENPGFMQIAIPYHKRWKAYVDGNPVKVYKSGGMYLGFVLDEGQHNILLRYI